MEGLGTQRAGHRGCRWWSWSSLCACARPGAQDSRVACWQVTRSRHSEPAPPPRRLLLGCWVFSAGAAAGLAAKRPSRCASCPSRAFPVLQWEKATARLQAPGHAWSPSDSRGRGRGRQVPGQPERLRETLCQDRVRERLGMQLGDGAPGAQPQGQKKKEPVPSLRHGAGGPGPGTAVPGGTCFRPRDGLSSGPPGGRVQRARWGLWQAPSPCPGLCPAA